MVGSLFLSCCSRKKSKKLQRKIKEMLFSIHVKVWKSLVISLGLVFITAEMGALTGVTGQSKHSAFSFYVLTKHGYQNWHPVLTYRCIFLVETFAYKNEDFCHNACSELSNTHKPAGVGSCLGSAGANFNMVIFFWQLFCFCFAAVMLVLVLVHWHLLWMFRFCLLHVEMSVYLQMSIKFWVYIKQRNEDKQMKLWELTMSIYNIKYHKEIKKYSQLS